MNNIKTVAVIGGGVAGLAAAGLLAQNGYRTKLYEANAKLGGCCATTTVQGYTFNDGASCLVSPGLLDYVFSRLHLDRASLLTLVQIEKNHTVYLPDGTTVVFGKGRELQISNPHRCIDSNRISNDLQTLLYKWQPILDIFTNDLAIHPLSLMRLIHHTWRHLHKLRGSIGKELNKIFHDNAVRAALSTITLYTGLPADKSPVIGILGLIAMLSEGYFIPKGGMGRIPQALSKAAIQHGAEIHLNTKISRIMVERGRVKAVIIDEQHREDVDAVISTVSAMHTYLSLLERGDIATKIQEKVHNTPLSFKTCMLQLGLSHIINDETHNVSRVPMMDQQYQIFEPDANVRWPIYTVPTVTLPELAPHGCSIVEMYPPIDRKRAPEDWSEDYKNQVIESSIDALARYHAIDIKVKRLLSPKEFQEDLHLFQGAIYGVDPNKGPRIQFPHQSTITGLYQAGQTTYPGFGVAPAAMSGLFAADLLMHRFHHVQHRGRNPVGPLVPTK